MKLEVLVSTMNRSDLDFLDNMNLTTDALVMNQAERESIESVVHNGIRTLFITSKERGLSNSRNRLIEHATGDICIFADDDVQYFEDYENTILNAHKQHPDFDIITFKMVTLGHVRTKKYMKKKCKIGLLRSMKITSPEVSFKLERVKGTGIKFDSLFGAGARYQAGEENIFLKQCIKKGLKVLYIPIPILKIEDSESTWFKGYDEKYLHNRGAIFGALFNKLAIPIILQFAIRKYKLFKNISFLMILTHMYCGLREYKNLTKNGNQYLHNS
ncbi:glycosyltransferase family A protein [Cohnella pontilimi]|nr:glycosyltransferase family A protein [Cohnella pontilimi]